MVPTVDFDLCEACSQLRLREMHDTNGKLHHVWHPLIKLARSVVEIPKQDRSQFSTMVLRLHREQDISPSAIYEDTSGALLDNNDAFLLTDQLILSGLLCIVCALPN